MQYKGQYKGTWNNADTDTWSERGGFGVQLQFSVHFFEQRETRASESGLSLF